MRQVALGGTVDTSGGYTLATGRLQGKGEADALYIWNHETRKLGIYFANNRNLEVIAIRDCSYDFAVPGFSARNGKQIPPASDMKKASSGG